MTIRQIGMWQNCMNLPANVDVRMVLTKAKDAFALQDDNHDLKPGVTWSHHGENTVRLMLRRVYASSAMQDVFEKAILERPLRYNLTGSRVKRVNIGHSTSVDLMNKLTGVRADVVVVQFVASKAVEGDLMCNPGASLSVIQHSPHTEREYKAAVAAVV